MAIVTASTRGIGFSIAERLGLEGASVVISSRRQVHYCPSNFHFQSFLQKLFCHHAWIRISEKREWKRGIFCFIRFWDSSTQSKFIPEKLEVISYSILFFFGLYYRRRMLMRLQKNSELMESKYWQLFATFQMPSKGRI